jgi:hypothetical protein
MPPVPEVLTVRREGGHAKITYAFAGGDRGSATGLLVTLSSPDDKYPPLTDTVAIEAGSGTVTAPARLDARQRYVVAVSSINDQGATSRVLERTLSPGG